MGLHTAFTALAEVIDAYESRGRSVRTVEASPAETDGAVLDVTVSMPVSVCSGEGDGLTPKSAMLTDSGDLRVEFSPAATELPSTAAASLSVGDASAAVTDDGLLLTVNLRIDATAAADEAASVDSGPEQGETDASAAISSVSSPDTDSNNSLPVSDVADTEAAPADDDASQARAQSDNTATDDTQSEPASEGESDPFAAVRDDSVPPYEDTDYLQALYDECDNFKEIAEQIQMDVSSETVRRYMIEADIHVPNTYNTSSDDVESATESGKPDDVASQSGADGEDDQVSVADPVAAESPGPGTDSVGDLPDDQLVTDGLGLPADVQLRDVAEAVVDSDTVYEVQRCLSLNRSQTRNLLEELNLLDLVLCRLTDEPDHAVSYGTVASRIRQCTPHSA
ncbi:hypothetical protein Harman_32330 [Haloarcula mannanilytica]|uniref:Uncharacterized protein n=1 Tax=Haloarcula mannanilytica TaxID=2509225 RepID=A0A4C2EL86_9EURY|nr:hypothetical protein [Haloarcula mannanilytica]GCF15298.1 hypothetical protein Harman_32330 [Haloarcula mannanilytica]